LDLVVGLNYFYFSYPNPNPTHLPKHEFLSPNNHFYQRIWYVECYSVHAYTVWSQKFRKSEISLDTGLYNGAQILDHDWIWSELMDKNCVIFVIKKLYFANF